MGCEGLSYIIHRHRSFFFSLIAFRSRRLGRPYSVYWCLLVCIDVFGDVCPESPLHMKEIKIQTNLSKCYLKRQIEFSCCVFYRSICKCSLLTVSLLNGFTENSRSTLKLIIEFLQSFKGPERPLHNKILEWIMSGDSGIYCRTFFFVLENTRDKS